MEAMTLEQVRDRIDKLAGQNKVYASVHVAELTEWMIALDAHLTQPAQAVDAETVRECHEYWAELMGERPEAPLPSADREQEAAAWQIRARGRDWEACTKECYDDTLRTGRYMGLPAGTTDVEVRELYTRALGAAQAVDDGMLPDALVPHSKEWYRLCERRFAVERMTISGELAEAIVKAISERTTRALSGEKAEGWRDIATAPKDGTEVLIFVPGSGEQFVAYWNKRFEAWLYAATSSGVRVFTKEATHWMPLPASPTPDKEGK